jgi:hypothetical protein
VNWSQGKRVKGEEGQPAELRAHAIAAELGFRHERRELLGWPPVRVEVLLEVDRT